MGCERTVQISLLVLVGALAGCETTPREQLEGVWVGERVDAFPAAQAEPAAGWVRGTSFTFSGPRVRVSIPAESDREGTYEVVSASEDGRMRIAILRPTGGRDEVDFQLEGEERDQLRWHVGDGRSIVLRRVASDS